MITYIIDLGKAHSVKTRKQKIIDINSIVVTEEDVLEVLRPLLYW